MTTTACDVCPARLALARVVGEDHARLADLNDTVATLSSLLLRADPDLWVATMGDLAARQAVRRSQQKEPQP